MTGWASYRPLTGRSARAGPGGPAECRAPCACCGSPSPPTSSASPSRSPTRACAVEWVEVDPADRSPVRELSGQDLVPVLQTDQNEVIVDSMRIVAWLEARRPDPPLWPADPARRAEVDVFVEWFNRVWKTPAERDRGRARPPAARPREDRRLGRGDARVAALVRGPPRGPRPPDGRHLRAPPTSPPSRSSSTASSAIRTTTSRSIGSSSTICRSRAHSPTSRPGSDGSTPAHERDNANPTAQDDQTFMGA